MRKNVKKAVAVLFVFWALIFTKENNVYAYEESEEEELFEYAEEVVSERFPDASDEEKSEMIDEIIEKYTPQERIILKKSIDEPFIDIAYQKMLERENYVVDLINSIDENKTTMENWKYNLHYLLDNYEYLVSVEKSNKIFIDCYIEDYSAQEEYEKTVSQKKTDGKIQNTEQKRIKRSPSSYKYKDAVAYAEKYYKNYNPNYPDWEIYGGDCANFVSQCLYAGGKQMTGVPGTAESAQDWSNWFSKGSVCDTQNVSSTWRGANAFKGYWTQNANHETFEGFCEEVYDYGLNGDAVSLLNENGKAYHTLIIVGYYYVIDEEPDFIVAAHTNDTKTSRLSSYYMPGGLIIYRMR